MRFTAKIKDGKIVWHDIEGVAEHLNLIDGEEVYIDIKASNVRNTAQNNYYWSILRDWGNDIGHTAEELHDIIKSHFKLKTINEFNKDEFSEFLTEVERYAAQNGWNGKSRSTKLP